MDRSTRERWADSLRPALAQMKNDPGIAQVARDIDVSRATLSSFLGGSVPSEQTLREVYEWLDRHGYGAVPGPEDVKTDVVLRGDDESVYVEAKSGEGWTARREGSPAEQLIYMVQHPEMLRRFSGTPSMKDAVKAAFAIAVDENFSDEEMDKLQAWRRDVLSQEGE